LTAKVRNKIYFRLFIILKSPVGFTSKKVLFLRKTRAIKRETNEFRKRSQIKSITINA